jgi:hypothetical protein
MITRTFMNVKTTTTTASHSGLTDAKMLVSHDASVIRTRTIHKIIKRLSTLSMLSADQIKQCEQHEPKQIN